MKNTRSLSALALLVTMSLGACSPQPASGPTSAASESAVAAESEATAGAKPPALVATEAAAAVPVPVPPSFRALGTEPFWSARVDADKLSWSTPEQPEGLTVPVKRQDVAGKVILSGEVGGKALVLEVSVGSCSDGMSDTVYPLTVVRRIGNDTQRGCAR
ncbi:MAG: hypothetical protein C0491_05645 [Novosphingobium sp.]|nr:hypothetical protein [Novosphingobium sp.]